METMTQKEKELLLKDLCARLPYGVKVKTLLKEPYTLKGLFDTEYGGVMGCLLGKFVPNNVSPKTVNYPLEQFKPYLFPLSSMTEEQKKEYNYWKHVVPVCHYEYGDVVEEIELYDSPESFEYLIENHFDYRGLIEKGVAIDATGLNIY